MSDLSKISSSDVQEVEDEHEEAPLQRLCIFQIWLEPPEGERRMTTEAKEVGASYVGPQHLFRWRFTIGITHFQTHWLTRRS